MRRPRRQLPGWVGPLALTAAAILLLLVPATAGAALGPVDIPSPTDLLPDIPSPGDAITGGIKDAVEEAIKFLLSSFFHLPGKVTKQLAPALVAHPVYTDASYAKLQGYQSYVAAGAWGVLGLTFTISAFRFWASGLTSGGAYEALQGLVRSIAAAAGLLAFPAAFGMASVATNMFTHALLEGPGVASGIDTLFAAALAFNIATLGIGTIASVMATVLLVALLITKIVLSAALAMLFVAGPLAIALWPLPETSWAARTVLQTTFGILLWPVVWALCFSAVAVLGNTAFEFDGGLGSLIKPFVTVAALYVAWKAPKVALQQAMIAGVTGGGLSPLASAGMAQRVLRSGGGAPAGAASGGGSAAGSAAGGAAKSAAGAAV